MTYEEYVDRIKEIFLGCGYSQEQADKYFATEEVREYLQDSYSYLDNKNVAASVTPQAVASNLDLMY